MGVFVILLFFVVVVDVVLLLYVRLRASRRNRARSNPWRNRRAPARFKVLCRDGCCTRSREYCDCYSKNIITLKRKKNYKYNDFYHVGHFFKGPWTRKKRFFVCACRALSVRLPDSRGVSRSNYGITHELEYDEKKITSLITK